MAVSKIAITLERELLAEVDRLVREGVYPNRSRAIRDAVRERLARLQHRRLAEQLANLDPREEKALAEEGFRAERRAWRRR